MQHTFRAILRLIRPKHWLKNLLVAVPLFITFSFTQEHIAATGLLFVAFCLLASSVYVINDLFDRERDRQHPTKKSRPIAAGIITVPQAIVLHTTLLISSMLLANYLDRQAFIVVLIYYGMNVLYSMGLKKIPILDVFILALGFVLRISAGSHVIDVKMSQWLLLCAFVTSLFMAFGKRRHEMLLLTDSKSSHRAAITEYTEGFINQLLAISATITIVFYSLYTIDPATQDRFNGSQLLYTMPLLTFLVFRYFFLLYNRNTGGDPVEVITNDRALLLGTIGFVLMIVLARYGHLSLLSTLF
jgi:4-hydroxybenzoate polyprenyltransferase